MTGSRVTRLRGGVTRKPSIGAESYAVTRLRGGHTCACGCVGACVQARVCVRAMRRNRVTA